MALVLSSPGKHVNVFAGCVGMAWKGGLKSVNSLRDIGNHVRDPYFIEMRIKSQIFYNSCDIINTLHSRKLHERNYKSNGHKN